MSLALFLYNAPVFAGGDKEEAVRVLESIASSDTADSLDRYTALICLPSPCTRPETKKKLHNISMMRALSIPQMPGLMPC